MIKQLFLLILIFFIFIISLTENSLTYQIDLANNSLNLNITDNKIKLPVKNSSNSIIISLNPQNRYSTQQYLILDKGPLQNGFELFTSLLFRKKNKNINLDTFFKTDIKLIHFNPFRSSLIINYGSNYYRFEVNVPDTSLEVWNEDEKLKNYSLKIPWIKLIIYPLINSLAIGVFLFTLLLTINHSKQIKIMPKFRLFELSKTTVFDKIIALVIFLTASVIIGLIFFKVTEAMPGFGDEINYLIQAKIFAAGKLFINEPSNSEFFRVGWMDIFGSDKKLWNFHPPGNSIILILGQLIKIDWITIPLIGGLILLTQYFLALNLFGKRIIALLHVIIIGTSHYFLTLSSSYMAHAPSFLFISLFYLFLVKYFKKNQAIFLFSASASMGFAFVIRPVSALLGSIVPLVFLFFFWLKEKKFETINIITSLLIGLLISSFVFLYSYKVGGKLTFPYLLKGPEAGQTLQVRWSKGWDYRLSNLYRNSNEFQNRAHSFGYLFNYIFFLFPLFTLAKNKDRLVILGAYFAFLSYLILHSFLHWYGWKWEPRMIYDISFIFYLLTSYGIWQAYVMFSLNKFQKFISITLFLGVIFLIVFINLPYRFNNEYFKYNLNPAGVRNLIKERKISNAIIFYTDDKIFAPYIIQNELNFAGDIIYALSHNEDHDRKLIIRYPNKNIYYTTDGNSLVKKPNFYKEDLAILRQDLNQNFNNKKIYIIIPWLKIDSKSIYETLPGEKITSQEFIDLIMSNKIKNETLVVFIDRSQNLLPLLKNYYQYESLNKSFFSTPVIYMQILKKNPTPSSTIPLIKMNCYQNHGWEGIPLKSELVDTVNISDCYGENKSAEWTTYISQKKSKKITFSLMVDDESEIIIDNQSILKSNQNIIKQSELTLTEGIHILKIRFYNGPNGEYLNLGLTDSHVAEEKISINSSILNFYLPKEQWN